MDWGSVIGAISDTGIAIGSGIYDYMAEKRQASREDTAYQRAVADAEKAGINPASLFSGSGSAASSSATSSSDNWSQAAAQASVLASNLAVNRANIANTDADTKLKEVQARNVASSTVNEQRLTDAQVSEIISRTKLNDAEVVKINAELPGIIASSDLASFDSKQELAFCSVLGISTKDKDRAIEIMKSGDWAMLGAFILMNASPEIVNALSSAGSDLMGYVVDFVKSQIKKLGKSEADSEGHVSFVFNFSSADREKLIQNYVQSRKSGVPEGEYDPQAGGFNIEGSPFSSGYSRYH